MSNFFIFNHVRKFVNDLFHFVDRGCYVIISVNVNSKNSFALFVRSSFNVNQSVISDVYGDVFVTMFFLIC
jgi:hypothetical protein